MFVALLFLTLPPIEARAQITLLPSQWQLPAAASSVEVAAVKGPAEDREFYRFDPSARRLATIDASGLLDHRSEIPANGATAVAIPLRGHGLQLLALDAAPVVITVDAATWSNALAVTGIRSVPPQSDTGVRVRVRRYSSATALIRRGAGRAAGLAAGSAAGNPLEIVLVDNPYAGGEHVPALTLRLLFRGQPLADAPVLLDAFPLGLDQPGMPRANHRSDARGEDQLGVIADPPGVYIFWATHAVRLAGDPEADYELYFATLSLGYDPRPHSSR